MYVCLCKFPSNTYSAKNDLYVTSVAEELNKYTPAKTFEIFQYSECSTVLPQHFMIMLFGSKDTNHLSHKSTHIRIYTQKQMHAHTYTYTAFYSFR